MKGHSMAILNATYSDEHDGSVVLSGCGYEMEPVTLEIHYADGGTQRYGIGVLWNEGEGSGCLDHNYILIEGHSGLWTINAFQPSPHGQHKLALVASGQVKVP